MMFEIYAIIYLIVGFILNVSLICSFSFKHVKRLRYKDLLSATTLSFIWLPAYIFVGLCCLINWLDDVSDQPIFKDKK